MTKSNSKNNLQGILWILLNNMVMVLQNAMIKNLSQEMHKFQVVILYKIAVAVFLLPIIFYKGVSTIKTQKMHLLGLKALLSITAAMIYVSALEHLPITEAISVCYTEHLFASLLAVIILKEYINKHLIIAILCGLIGVIIVIKPINTEFNVYYLVVMLASIIWAFDFIVVKMLGRTESPIQYVFYVALFSSVLGLIEAYSHSYFVNKPMPEWSDIDLGKHYLKLVFMTLLYFIHVVSVFKAYQKTNVSILAPFEFSRIIFATSLDAIMFGTAIGPHTILGAFIIMASSVYIVWKKEEHKRQIKDINNKKTDKEKEVKYE